MHRRAFLSQAALLATGAVHPLSPGLALAQPSKELRRLIWYATHCVDCGAHCQRPVSFDSIERGCFNFCSVCQHGFTRPECYWYRDNPPDWV